jgi:hypothetical protein
VSLKRWAVKRDVSEAAIVQALRRAGAKVVLLSEFDMLVWFRGALFMLDAKGERGRITGRQQALLDDGFPLRFAKTPQEALKAIGAIR